MFKNSLQENADENTLVVGGLRGIVEVELGRADRVHDDVEDAELSGGEGLSLIHI